MVSFSGTCLVHRAEIMAVARRLVQRPRRGAAGGRALRTGVELGGVAQALYRQGELHRLRGEFAAADEAYGARAGEDWSRSLA